MARNARMEAKTPKVTIRAALDEFLTDQKSRLAKRTFSQYADIIHLFESCLEGYWPGHTGEYEGDSGKKYCERFGPEEIPDAYSEFLGYFMPRKVMCGKDTLRCAGTVTKKLAKWLVEKGYIDEDDGGDAAERAGEASRDLPASAEALDILTAYTDDADVGPFTESIDDHFTITRVAPGRVWLEPLTRGGKALGPIAVPEDVTALLKAGWDLGGVVGKARSGWQLSEVWNLSP